MAISIFTVGPEQRVNSYTAGAQTEPRATQLEDGGWLVTWTSAGQDGSGTGIYQQRYDGSGDPVGGEVRVNTYRTNDQNEPTVTSLADGGWVVTWVSDGNDGNWYGIAQQRYASDGSPIDGEVQVNTYSHAAQAGSSVTALKGGGWLVTWYSWQDGSEMGVYQQRYDATGSRVGGEIQVNTTTADSQRDPHVTALSDGGWVVTWMSEEPGNIYNYGDIYQQRYDAMGNKVGGEVRVNTALAKDQDEPHVTALPDGGWIVVWTTDNLDGSGRSLFQQRYNAFGQPQGGETRVHTATMLDNRVTNASVTALDDGGWIISFEGYEGIYQQRYTSEGVALFVGSPLVNTSVEAVQEHSSITQLKDGTWLVTWQSGTGDRLESDIYQRRYFNGDALTTGQEIAAGDHADDTFLVRLGSLSEGDDISGGSGIDTLQMVDAGVIDLSKPGSLTGVEIVSGSAGNDMIIADDRIAGITTLRGGNGQDELRLLSNSYDQRGHYDLRGKTFAGIEVIRLMASGSLTFSDKATAFLMHAVAGTEVTLKLDGGSFTDAEKVQLFRKGIKTIKDDLGTYTNAAPDQLTLTGQAVFEKSGNGAVVGTLSALDPNPTDTTFTYELLDPAEERFELVTENGVTRVVVKDGSLLDYETAQSHQITVKVTDDEGASFTKSLTIAVRDVMEEIKGTNSKNVLKGGIGSDKLYGYYGNDTLTGGAGSDVFVFNARLGSATSDRTVNFDRIADFSVAADTIQLENAIFKSLKTTRTLSSKCFVSGAKAKDKNDYIGYDKKTGRVWYDADGSGSKAAVEFAQLAKSLKLTAKDFYVI